MKHTIAIDLPVLLQGDIHRVDVPLLYDVLEKITGLKNVEVLFCNADLQFLYENANYAFTCNIMKFLSDVKLSEYDGSARKEALTYAPDIVSGLEAKLADAVYLQLCVIHTNDKTGSAITFTGFIPRFSEKFQLRTTRDKKTRGHETVIISSDNDANIKWTGLDDGYYFITTTTGTLVTVDSVAPNAIVKDKNTPPTIDKTVEEDSSSEYQKQNSLHTEKYTK